MEQNGDGDLLDYDENEQQDETESVHTVDEPKKKIKWGHVSVHVAGFRDLLLKPELLQAISECGFENPSEVQYECIPEAVSGRDIICQGKSGMGKTAVFVLSSLQQLDLSNDEVSVLVMCHTRELAFQISKEYERFSKYLPALKVAVFVGGLEIKNDIHKLETDCPHVVVGTPGRVSSLIRQKKLNTNYIVHFILDECDKLLEEIDMRRDIQAIFLRLPREKQVMMFSATLSHEVRPLCKKYTQNPMEVFVDNESLLTLNMLEQYYIMMMEDEKNQKLFQLLDVIEFNQVLVFVRSIQRCTALAEVFVAQEYPAVAIHSSMEQVERLARYQQFKEFKKRILVATDLFGRGIDIERVNFVINYDMPEKTDTYLHRVGRAGRFGTRGYALSFITNQEETDILTDVQERFDVDIKDFPDHNYIS